jgi:ComF family protein
MRGLLNLLLTTILPHRCLSCGGPLSGDGGLCGPCWEAVTFIAPPFCFRCGLPFELDGGSATLCGPCLLDPPRFHRARSVFRYDSASKGMILGFKHADRTARAPHFARWMARAGAELLAEADLLVPVPLHPWRLLQRRYNQAALLAQAVGKLTSVACCPDALSRVRHTPKQGIGGRLGRQANLHGAIRLRQTEKVAGRNILLIDDVLTTGATVEECVRTLKEGNARQVDVLTLARVVRAGG